MASNYENFDNLDIMDQSMIPFLYQAKSEFDTENYIKNGENGCRIKRKKLLLEW